MLLQSLCQTANKFGIFHRKIVAMLFHLFGKDCGGLVAHSPIFGYSLAVGNIPNVVCTIFKGAKVVGYNVFIVSHIVQQLEFLRFKLCPTIFYFLVGWWELPVLCLNHGKKFVCEVISYLKIPLAGNVCWDNLVVIKLTLKKVSLVKRDKCFCPSFALGFDKLVFVSHIYWGLITMFNVNARLMPNLLKLFVNKQKFSLFYTFA